MADIALRPYQDTSAANIRGAFVQGIRGVLLVSPTGSGKTVTFSYIAKGAAARGNPTLILAHRDTLIKQASRKLTEYGVHHGIIMAGFTPSPHAMVQVGSVQTMVRRIRKHKYDFKLIIIDEAHLSAARTYMEIIDAFPEARILGVTGSPCRLDGRGLGTGAGGRYDYMIESVSIAELIADAYAVQPVVYAPLQRLDLSKVPKEGADYQKRALSAAVNTKIITGNAIDHWREHAKHVPSATWCVDVQHARDTARDFNAAGIKSVMLYGHSSSDERDTALRQLADGTIYNITFCQLLVEGIDCAEIGCIIGLRPTHSLAAYLQTLGRMSRPLYKKGMPQDTREQRFAAMDAGQKGRRGIFLDTVGITFRHGFQDDDREWSLLGEPSKSKREASVPARQCPKCMATFRPQPICPECGHVFDINARVIKTEEGSLGELTREMVGATKRARRIELSQATTREDFQRIAQERNYSPMWVNIQMRIADAKAERQKLKNGQKQQWLEQQAQAVLSNPQFQLDKDWTEL